MRLYVLLLMLALPACAGSSGDQSTPQATEAPTADPTRDPTASATRSPTRSADASATARTGETLTGTLGADSIEGGCAYLQTEDGTRYEVIYPDGWNIQAEPLTLTNPDGEVVARGGESITVRGREAREMASICQIGPIFEADEVVAID